MIAKKKLARYIQPAMFSPCIRMMQQVSLNRNLLWWPMETLILKKSNKKTLSSEKGYLDQEKRSRFNKNIRRTVRCLR